MVNIGIVKEASLSYYVESEQLSMDEYYSVEGTETGQWIGLAAQELKLDTTVNTEAFIHVMHGRSPLTEEPLSPHFGNRKVLGIDVVFRAPKSVSLLLAVSTDARVQSAVASAHGQATARALMYLEGHALGGREGKAGWKKVRGSGAIGSAWRHVTSRAGDPLLHTHVVLANMIHSESGKWVTIDSQKLHAHAKTLGHVYQAELRRQLTATLGVGWEKVENGCADISGIDRGVIKHFSKRRDEIEAYVDGKIEDPNDPTMSRTGAAMEAATVETRRAKKSEPNADAFERWRAEAESIGFGDAQIEAVCGRLQIADLAVDTAALFDDLAKPEGLTRHRATFSRLLVVEEVANRVPASAGADAIERIADDWIAQYAVQLEPNQLEGGGNYKVSKSGEPALTTVAMLEVEQSIIQSSEARQNSKTASAPARRIQGFIDRHSTVELNPGQRAMIASVMTSGNGVDVVIGDAGTGKTTALGTLRAIYEDQGTYKVVGAALAHAAKDQLAFGAGIESRTLAAILSDIERGDLQRAFPMGKKTVLVIDEAAMIETWDMAKVLDGASIAGAKVVLVGDPKQLPAIGAGGWFDLVAERVGSSRLTENLRQQDPIEKQIVDHMATGRSSEAFELARSSGRIVECGNTDEAAKQIIEDIEKLQDGVNWLVLAGTNAEADSFNSWYQRKRYYDKHGEPRPYCGDRITFDPGDEVMFRTNVRELKVTNRERGVVLGVSPETGALTVRLSKSGREVELPSHLAENQKQFGLGYAATVHRGQGVTVDNSYLLAGATLAREDMYVAISRGRKLNKVFATKGWFENEAGYGEDLEIDSMGRVRSSFQRSGSEGSAAQYGQAKTRVEAVDAAKRAQVETQQQIARGGGGLSL